MASNNIVPNLIAVFKQNEQKISKKYLKNILLENLIFRNLPDKISLQGQHYQTFIKLYVGVLWSLKSLKGS